MIYVVRHGQTDWNAQKLIQGQSDIPLNETGKQQALEMKKQLKEINFDYIFTSTLSRTIETARIITGRDDIITDGRLVENGHGILEGMSVTEVNRIKNSPGFHRKDYGIEEPDDIMKRVSSFVDEIRSKYSGKNILIVTHAGTSLYINACFNGIPEGGIYSNGIPGNCHIFTFEND